MTPESEGCYCYSFLIFFLFANALLALPVDNMLAVNNIMSNNDRNLLEFLGVSRAALPTDDVNSLVISDLLFSSLNKYVLNCKYYDLNTTATTFAVRTNTFHVSDTVP